MHNAREFHHRGLQQQQLPHQNQQQLVPHLEPLHRHRQLEPPRHCQPLQFVGQFSR